MVLQSRSVTDAIEEDEMAEVERDNEHPVDADSTDVDTQSAPEVTADDDVEAHVWRAQS